MYLNTVFKYNVFKYCPALDLLETDPSKKVNVFSMAALLFSMRLKKPLIAST